MADALVDGDADGESDASKHDLAGLVLVLIDGVGALLNELVTELANIHDLGAGDALQSIRTTNAIRTKHSSLQTIF